MIDSIRLVRVHPAFRYEFGATTTTDLDYVPYKRLKTLHRWSNDDMLSKTAAEWWMDVNSAISHLLRWYCIICEHIYIWLKINTTLICQHQHVILTN